MSVNQKFSTFCSNLVMDDASVSKIQNRYRQITKRINTEYHDKDSYTDNSWYVGSYGRNTDIWTSDIDIIVRLPYEVYERFNQHSDNGQSKLLQDLKNKIQKTYGTSFLKGDGQVVGLNFTDGISFEIIPGFINKDKISFTYPDTNNNGSWKTTNPRAEIKEFNRMNKTTNQNLKRLCRMMRAWKEESNVPISGFLLDTLAYRFIINWEYRDKSYLYYDFMTRDFLLYLKNKSKDKKYWLAPVSNQQVYKTGNFQSKSAKAYETSLEAIGHENKDMPFTANKKWREIYGSRFPN